MVLRGDPQCNDVLRNFIQRGCVESVKYKNIIVIVLVVRHSLLNLGLPHRVPLPSVRSNGSELHEIVPKIRLDSSHCQFVHILLPINERKSSHCFLYDYICRYC